MKKIFATAFVGASALALAACAGEAPADEAVEETADAMVEEADAMAAESEAMIEEGADAVEEASAEAAEDTDLDGNSNPIGPR